MRSLSDLKPGDKIPELHLPPISRLQLALYCGGSGDHNPIHVDSDFAEDSGMKDVFAHGMLSMGLMGRILTGFVPLGSIKSFGVRFVAITWVGDQITVRGHVRDTNAELRQLTLDLTCVNQNGDTTLHGQAVISIQHLLA